MLAIKPGIDKIKAFARRAAEASINGKVIRIEICTCGMALRGRLNELRQVRLISWDRIEADTSAELMADIEIGALVTLLDIRAATAGRASALPGAPPSWPHGSAMI